MENEIRNSNDDNPKNQPGHFLWWRRLHVLSSGILAVISLVHLGFTIILYSSWSPDAVWFFGSGLGILMLAGFNLAHIGVEPCYERSTQFVRWANWVFLLFGLSVLIPIPEPQAYAIVICLIGQGVASRWTMLGRLKMDKQ